MHRPDLQAVGRSPVEHLEGGQPAAAPFGMLHRQMAASSAPDTTKVPLVDMAMLVSVSEWVFIVQISRPAE